MENPEIKNSLDAYVETEGKKLDADLGEVGKKLSEINPNDLTPEQLGKLVGAVAMILGPVLIIGGVSGIEYAYEDFINFDISSTTAFLKNASMFIGSLSGILLGAGVFFEGCSQFTKKLQKN